MIANDTISKNVESYDLWRNVFKIHTIFLFIVIIGL